MKKLTLITSFLGILIFANAQTEKNEISESTDSVQFVPKNELQLTPKITKTVIDALYVMYGDKDEKYLSKHGFGIKHRSQLENLHLGKPIPVYYIENEELMLSSNWNVPVMSDEETLLTVLIADTHDGEYAFVTIGTPTMAERIPNYEHKDLIIGCLSGYPKKDMDFLIIRKENQNIFVRVYDETTGEYFKNEYNFSEYINLLKECKLRKIEALNRYYDKVANKSELNITPEITEMLNTVFSRFKRSSDLKCSQFGIKDKSQLDHVQLGKPIPKYVIDNEKLKFIGKWEVLVMSDDEPLFMVTVKLEEDGQYRWAGDGSAGMARSIYNYEYKDLIIGFLGVEAASGRDYLIIRKDNQDIFVKTYDWDTREVFKTKRSFSEIINLIKK
jgi:hypothetical protein